jgi:predicted ATP-grasp superfamily ATP-dependent carboligase
MPRTNAGGRRGSGRIGVTGGGWLTSKLGTARDAGNRGREPRVRTVCSMPVNVLVLSTDPTLSLPLLRSLGAAGYRVDLAETGSWSPSRVSRHCRRYLALPPGAFVSALDEAVQRIGEHCRAAGVDVIVPADVPSTLFLGVHRHELGRSSHLFPIPDPALLQQFRDKWLFAGLMRRIGGPHPETILLADERDARGVDWSAGPRFIKPSIGGFWVGAARLESEDDLERYLADEGARCEPPFILQEFIPGADVDCSVLCLDGNVIASATQAFGATPRTRVFLSDERVVGAATLIVRRTRYRGVVHFDMRIDARSGSVVVFEGNPRFWRSLSYATWAGLNFAALGVRAALGEQVEGGTYAVRPGPCRTPELGARDLLRGLLGGPGWTPATRAAWSATWSDPLPHLLARAVGAWERASWPRPRRATAAGLEGMAMPRVSPPTDRAAGNRRPAP